MDIISTSTNTPTAAKSPEPESETPTRIQLPPVTTTNNITATNTPKPLSLSNGVLKRHHPHHHHNHHFGNPATAVASAVTYKECLKNHAASLGGHAVDGCGEFMPSPNATAGDPSSIKCAACGCHRNFHRREPEEPPITTTTHVIEYQPHHRHHPPPPPPFQAPNRSPNSSSPPPISSSYYPSAPHMLLALSGGAGLSVPPESTAAPANPAAVAMASPRKRFRTKFTQEQKEKMHEFAERVGWKMQKRDDDLVMEFCNEVGVDRGVLKVWMHNNKNTLAKKDVGVGVANANGVVSVGVVGVGTRNVVMEQDHAHNNNNVVNSEINGGNENRHGGGQDQNQYENNDSGANLGTNGSSSSS